MRIRNIAVSSVAVLMVCQYVAEAADREPRGTPWMTIYGARRERMDYHSTPAATVVKCSAECTVNDPENQRIAKREGAMRRHPQVCSYDQKLRAVRRMNKFISSSARSGEAREQRQQIMDIELERHYLRCATWINADPEMMQFQRDARNREMDCVHRAIVEMHRNPPDRSRVRGMVGETEFIAPLSALEEAWKDSRPNACYERYHREDLLLERYEEQGGPPVEVVSRRKDTDARIAYAANKWTENRELLKCVRIASGIATRDAEEVYNTDGDYSGCEPPMSSNYNRLKLSGKPISAGIVLRWLIRMSGRIALRNPRLSNRDAAEIAYRRLAADLGQQMPGDEPETIIGSVVFYTEVTRAREIYEPGAMRSGRIAAKIALESAENSACRGSNRSLNVRYDGSITEVEQGKCLEIPHHYELTREYMPPSSMRYEPPTLEGWFPTESIRRYSYETMNGMDSPYTLSKNQDTAIQCVVRIGGMHGMVEHIPNNPYALKMTPLNVHHENNRYSIIVDATEPMDVAAAIRIDKWRRKRSALDGKLWYIKDDESISDAIPKRILAKYNGVARMLRAAQAAYGIARRKMSLSDVGTSQHIIKWMRRTYPAWMVEIAEETFDAIAAEREAATAPYAHF
jgi:hypothetical protein